MLIHLTIIVLIVFSTLIIINVEAKVSFILSKENNYEIWNKNIKSIKASFKIDGKGIECCSNSPFIENSTCKMEEKNGASVWSTDICIYFKDGVSINTFYVQTIANK